MYYVFKTCCKGLMKLISAPKVFGRDSIPHQGSFVLVANHQSLLDPLILVACIPRKITFLAAAYIFKIPLVGQIVRAVGALPVKSLKGNYKTMKHSLSRLAKGGVVGIFPEGGVSLDGELRPFMSGWAYLALKTGVPVIPVAISGTREVLPVGRYIPQRSRIRINIGKPVYIDKKSKIRREHLDELSTKMMNIISRLLEMPDLGCMKDVF